MIIIIFINIAIIISATPQSHSPLPTQYHIHNIKNSRKLFTTLRQIADHQ